MISWFHSKLLLYWSDMVWYTPQANIPQNVLSHFFAFLISASWPQSVMQKWKRQPPWCSSLFGSGRKGVSRFKGWHHRTAGVAACLDRIRCTEMEAPASAVPWIHRTSLDRATSPVEPNARFRWPNEVSEAHWRAKTLSRIYRNDSQ